MDSRILAFSVAEYRDRTRRVQDRMAELGLDALLCHSFDSTCYLTGLQSVMGPAKYFMTVVPAEGDPFLLGQDFELHNARLTSWVEDLTAHPVFEDPVEASRVLLAGRGLAGKRLGVEMKRLCMNPLQFASLRQALPEAQLVDASSLVPSIRMLKSAAELDYMRRACRISSRAMEAAVGAVAEGRTDNEVAAVAVEVCFREGGEFFCLEPIVSLGDRSSVPHSSFAGNRARSGDLCFIEIGANIQRYSGPLIRTVALGEPDAEVSRAGAEAAASLNAVIAAMRPGVTAQAVAFEGRKAWEWTASHPEYVWNGAYAYSVGLGFPSDWCWCDAWLFIHEREEAVLQPGMVFHCTNNIRRPGVFGLGISETVAITDSGAEVLTSFDRRLLVR